MKALKEKLDALKKKKESIKQGHESAQNAEPKQEAQKSVDDASIEDQINNISVTPSQNADTALNTPAPGNSDAIKSNEPSYSVFVGNFGPKIKKEQLDDHFSCCGTIKRSTIVQDHFTHLPKGYAYIEFENKEGMDNALKLDSTLLCGNTIEVKPKREKNIRKPFRGRRRRFRRS